MLKGTRRPSSEEGKKCFDFGPKGESFTDAVESAVFTRRRVAVCGRDKQTVRQ
jgi:hypothetical protein